MKKVVVWFTAVFAAVWVQLALAAAPSASPSFTEGKEYELLAYPVPTRDETKIEVVELFWYGCGHCFNFEPHIHKWQKTLDQDVDFYQQPGDFGGWSNETQLHYTLEVLGLLDKGPVAVFDEYHKLNNKLRSESKRVKFFKSLGVSEADYKKAWGSFAVQSKVKMAQSRTRSYRITGVPAMIVAGKYKITTSSAGGFKGMLKVADFLIEKERAARAK